MSQPFDIDYAPRLPWLRRKKTRFIAVCMIATILLGYWGPDIWRHTNFVYWQYRCLHNETPDQAVYTSRPLQSAEQIAGDPITLGIYPLPRPVLFSGTGFDCWRRFKVWNPTISSNPPEEPIYVHQRISPGGNERLVVINLTVSEDLRISEYFGPTISVSINFRPQVIIPATFTKKPSEAGPRFSSFGKGEVAKEHASVFTVQSDPNNLSRFSIKYEVDNDIGLIEGRLLDNDTVKLDSAAINPTPVAAQIRLHAQQKAQDEWLASFMDVMTRQKLMTLLKSNNSNDRTAAVETIGAVRSAMIARSKLDPGYDSLFVPLLVRSLDDPDYIVQRSAIEALGHFGSAASKAVLRIANFLTQNDKDICLRAADALGAIGPAAKPAVPTLIEALKSGPAAPTATPWLGEQSATALGKIGPAAKEAIPALTDAALHSSGEYRVLAAGALERVDPGNKDGLLALQQLLGQDPPYLRVLTVLTACQLDHELGGKEIPLLRQALSDSDLNVRDAATEELKHLERASSQPTRK